MYSCYLDWRIRIANKIYIGHVKECSKEQYKKCSRLRVTSLHRERTCAGIYTTDDEIYNTLLYCSESVLILISASGNRCEEMN